MLARLLLIENQYYVEMDQARRNHSIRSSVTRVNWADATYRIKNYIQILNEDNDILMFLRRAGHTMDGYNQGQVGPRPLVCYNLQNIHVPKLY